MRVAGAAGAAAGAGAGAAGGMMGSGMMAQGAGEAMGGVAKQGLLDSARSASAGMYDKAQDLRTGLLEDAGVEEDIGGGFGAAGHAANVQSGMQKGKIAEQNAIDFLARTRALQGQNLGMGGQY